MECLERIGMWVLPYVNISAMGYSGENVLCEMRI